MTASERALVVGVGNAWRRDDGVGLAVARRLRAELPPTVDVTECSGDLTSLLHAWHGRALVVLLDAMSSLGEPGRVHTFEPVGERHPVPAPQAAGTPRMAGLAALHSTHALGIAQAVALGEALGLLPRRLVVYAVEGRDWRHGDMLSPPVARAVDEVVRLVRDAVAAPLA